MSSLTVEEDQKWVPTHVQVTVLRGRGLRGKGKHGTSDVYTIIQLGKEKYSTCVAEKTTEPEWREECSFELQPGVLDRADRSGYPAGSSELVLTVMHRALIGLDVFLGQAAIQLDKLFGETRCVKNEWYRLNSKTGKKEKERGDIQVTVQFTRNNLTASMYDLVMKDKGASTFSKLKERMRGKRRASDEDSSSAVLPGGYGSLYRMRHRLPSDGGGEEDYEDDEGGEARRSKMRNFFLRGKLRKSSDTRSSTSLGSESSESSSRGGSLSPTAGISVVVSDLSNSPSNSSNLTADNSPEHTANTSPKSSSLHRCEFGEEAGEITIAVPQPTVCVNGSHAYNVQPLDPGSGKPADSLGLGVLQKPLPLSVSLQNLSPRASMDLPRSPVGDGRRWSFDKPDKEEKAAIAAALEQSGPMQGDEEAGGRLGQAVLPKAASTADLDNVKKQRRNLFSHGRSDSAGKGQSQSKERSGEATQEKHKGWLGSKDSHSKPSRVVSPKLEPSTDPHLPPLPSSQHPPGLPVHPPSLVSPLHHTNPFCHSQTASSLMSPANPFFCLLQHNPFYDDMLTAQPLKTSPPPLPYLSSSRPPIAQLFPQASNANPGHNRPTTEEPINVSGEKRDPATKVERRPLPPVPTEGGKPLSRKSSNPFVSLGEPESEWDESFEAFAAGRLQCPEDPTADCKTQQNTPSDEGMDADHNMNQAQNHQPHRKVLPEARKAPGQLTNTNTHHLDLFAHFLETIPEHRGFETDTVTSNTSADLPKLDAFTDTNQTGSTTNTKDFTNPHQAHCRTTSTQLSSSSPDPVSSGVGSSVEEDFLSCLSTSSDKFSASSSEEAEAHNFESNILGFGKSPENRKPSEAEDCSTGGTNDRSFPDVAQQTVIQQQLRDGGVDSNDSEEPLGTQSPTKGAEIESADTQTLNVSNIVYPDLLPNMSEIQPKPNSSSQSDGESREKGKNEYNSSVEELTGSSPSTFPSLHIITSSPDVRRDSSNLSFGSSSLGGQFTGWCSPEPFGGFGDFINTGSGPEFDKTLLHTPASEQSTSSFLQSLYVSADSQDYQTCESRLPSKSSELNQTLYSANSTLCGDLSEIHSTPDATSGLENSSKPANGEIKEADRSDESLCGGGDDKATTVLTMGDDSGLREPTAALDSSSTSCHPRRPSEGGVESPEVVLDDESSKRPQATLSTLHRSQSEGALTSLFDEVLLPSFGSDPGAVQESSLTQPGPDLPHLTSFDPPLTPDSRSSPVALSSSPPLAGASARLPPSTAPMPEETQQQQQRHQQQAANQQNSPHPVKPLTTAILAEEKRTEGRSVLATGLEKLKSTIHPGRSSQLSEQETDRKKCLTEGAGSYYHLTHSELVALLVQREAEMERQRAEFERQRVLLTKREVELRKLKPQVRDLEDYIDTLLVRIMEQKPTLLQVRSKYK